MSILQSIVFWLMVAAMFSTFADMERQRGKPEAAPKITVNHKLIDLNLRKL